VFAKPELIKWSRPSEFCEARYEEKRKIQFWEGGASANDVVQGQLGDCWLIGAFCSLVLLLLQI
jgi:hypothetical protein